MLTDFFSSAIQCFNVFWQVLMNDSLDCILLLQKMREGSEVRQAELFY